MTMKITSILTEDLIKVNIPGDTKEDVINAIIDLAAQSQKIKDIEKVRQAIFEREKIMSTGVGHRCSLRCDAECHRLSVTRS
jgi:mannitol/fructose-specific phosphotransferase system IIA component (Ntr-type)